MMDPEKLREVFEKCADVLNAGIELGIDVRENVNAICRTALLHFDKQNERDINALLLATLTPKSGRVQ